jgi:hypothetical protein
MKEERKEELKEEEEEEGKSGSWAEENFRVKPKGQYFWIRAFESYNS